MSMCLPKFAIDLASKARNKGIWLNDKYSSETVPLNWTSTIGLPSNTSRCRAGACSPSVPGTFVNRLWPRSRSASLPKRPPEGNRSIWLCDTLSAAIRLGSQCWLRSNSRNSWLCCNCRRASWAGSVCSGHDRSWLAVRIRCRSESGSVSDISVSLLWERSRVWRLVRWAKAVFSALVKMLWERLSSSLFIYNKK